MRPISVCMCFRNEGDQVEKTLKSLYRSLDTNKDLDVVVVNDFSDDDYDYSVVKTFPNLQYIVNSKRLGSSVSKEIAVQAAKYDQVLLVDAHMRFIDRNWFNVVNQYLEENDHKIYVLNTIGLLEDESIKELIHSCSYSIINDDSVFISKWSRYHLDDDSHATRVAVVMGASYFFTKTYWNYLRGYEGLISYGREEEFISIKSWGMGDGCQLIKDCKIAHLYRKTTPCAPILTRDVWYNILMICYTLMPQKYHDLITSRMENKFPTIYNEVIKSLDRDKISELKTYFIKNGYDYSKFDVINKLVKSRNNIN